MNYWQQRAVDLENQTYNLSKKNYKKIDEAFSKAQAKINEKIEKWYVRLAENNQVSLEEAKKLLDKNELKEFKWTLDEYIQYGQENAIDQRWLRELENASAKFHISKLNAELLEIRAEYEKAFAKENEVVEDTVKESYTDRYDHMAFEIQKGYGVGFKVAGVDREKLDKVIKKPWASDGKNFSDRIWTKKEQMVDALHGELIRSMLTGGNTKDAIKIMQRYVSKDVKNAKYAAARLIRTESSYFASEGQKECFKDLDVEKYEIVATLDNRTSDICQGMDGQVFDMKEFEAGVTAPPFHVNCRSTTAPYFDDEFAKGERAARDAEGDTYYVPSDMTYKEWKTKQDEESDLMSTSFRPKFTEKNINDKIVDKEGNLEKVISLSIKKVENSKFDLYVDEEFAYRRNKAVRNTEKLLDELTKKFDVDTFPFGKVVLTDFTKIGERYKTAIGMYYNLNDTIYLNVNYDTNDKILAFLQDERATFANKIDKLSPIKHEIGHKFYDKCVRNLAKSENIDYNIARDKIDSKIFNKIKELNTSGNKLFLLNKLSEYSYDYYEKHNYTEIIADCFTVYGDNEIANDLVDMLNGG